MRYLGSAILTVASSLWLGGMVCLALFLGAVFHRFGEEQRATAGIAASAMFAIFSHYQLYVAGAALVGTLLAYVADRRKIYFVLFVLLALATVGVVIFRMHFVNRIEELRGAGEINSARFKQLHEQSTALFKVCMALVAAAVVLLPAALRGGTRGNTAD